jgi:LysM repeat protein
MQRNYNTIKRVATVLAIFISLSVFSQEDDGFTDVIIDGKPAKMSMTTGEYKFIEDKVEDAKTVVTSIPKTKAIESIKSGSDKLHIVKAGETFYGISKQYEISIAHLKELNEIKTNTLSIGQTLRIGYVKRTTEVATKFWIVKKGETLYSIAKSNGLTVKELKELNNLDSNIIKIDAQLILK